MASRRIVMRLQERERRRREPKSQQKVKLGSKLNKTLEG
jgi:hypothetical protein